MLVKHQRKTSFIKYEKKQNYNENETRLVTYLTKICNSLFLNYRREHVWMCVSACY